eukprot:gene17768-20241_t
MAQNTSHKDATRCKVGQTAHLVASLRGLEHCREDRLFKDPFAELLGQNFGKGDEKVVLATAADSSFPRHYDGNIVAMNILPAGLIEAVAIRTRKIDDEAKRFLREQSPVQICVLGAGLDTRPWRLDLSEDTEAPNGLDTSAIKYFELDFAEIFQYKLLVLENAGATSKFNYISVQADLSLPGWIEKLTLAGFDSSVPTFWLLEGFTGYLTEDEFHSLFTTLTSLSAPHSRLVATFLTPVSRTKTSMHRFMPEVPIGEVTKHAGWAGEQEDIKVTGLQYQRTIMDNSMDGYFFVVADYNK